MKYLSWLKKESNLQTVDGKEIEVYSFNYDKDDEEVLSEWATHFRQQYCDDKNIDTLKLKKQSRKDFLILSKFPDEKSTKEDRRGPGVRAGDFAEIMIADFLEYSKKYWVPRIRYDEKPTKNSSTPGCDVVAFKIKDIKNFSLEDELFVVEVKAGFSKSKSNFKRLQDAVVDSKKDARRKSEALNALKQRFLSKNNVNDMNKIERFQDEVDYPYKQFYGAAALFSDYVFSDNEIENTDCTEHKYRDKLRLLVIKGIDMMPLVNALYNRAANEA